MKYKDFYNHLNESVDSFGSNSKIKDSSGKLIKVYHGTSANFSDFDTRLRGAWFASNPVSANAYAGINGEADRPKRNSRIIPVYLNIENPKILTDMDLENFIDEWIKHKNYKNSMKSLKSKTEHEGFDGIWFKSRTDRKHDVFVAFKPDQIKSVFSEYSEFYKHLISEGLDDVGSYKFSNTFETETVDEEDEESGETYKKEILQPVQIIKFKTVGGIPYVWYARQSRYDSSTWNIAFGVDKGHGPSGETKLDISKTGTGDALKIFSTVIEITNAFIEYDEDREVNRLVFESVGDNRTKLYLKRLVPRVDNFKLEDVSKSGETSTVMLIRTN